MLDYGIIGNCVTCALVKKNASIEWMCFPTFSSPSIFAKILDTKKGGSLEVKPVGEYKITQRYLRNTAILETLFESKKDLFKVIDFFPRYNKLLKGKYENLLKENNLIRIIMPVRGKPRIRLRYDPKPDYAREDCKYSENDNTLVCKASTHKINMMSNIPLDIIPNSDIISLDHSRFIAVGDNVENLTLKRCNEMLRATKTYWEKWCRTLVLPKENSKIIIRSAITLKLLTYSRTGAIIAAPTTSIPEEIGTKRTWDYRYCWVRDAAFCADALKKIGRDYEPKKLMEFIINKALEHDYIHIMYSITGETRLKEETLDHLSGFRDSRPVRIGNAAYNQIQHDIYGEMVDIMYLYFVYYEYEKKMSTKYWRFLKYIVNQIRFNWDKKDAGIWEFRDIPEHFTYSKLMCFVGVDRAIKLAQHFGREDLVKDWLDLREEIRYDIIKKGYNDEAGAFTIHYNSKKLDASLLKMAYHEFLDPTDPMMINTIKAVYNDLRTDYLVQRYRVKDDLGKSNSAFTICSFWLVQALDYIGEKEKARHIFDKLIKRANHLGLFSEDIDIATKKLTGNFPQAYTHIELINSAILLSEWSAKRKKIDWSEMPKRKKWF